MMRLFEEIDPQTRDKILWSQGTKPPSSWSFKTRPGRWQLGSIPRILDMQIAHRRKALSFQLEQSLYPYLLRKMANATDMQVNYPFWNFSREPTDHEANNIARQRLFSEYKNHRQYRVPTHILDEHALKEAVTAQAVALAQINVREAAVKRAAELKKLNDIAEENEIEEQIGEVERRISTVSVMTNSRRVQLATRAVPESEVVEDSPDWAPMRRSRSFGISMSRESMNRLNLARPTVRALQKKPTRNPFAGFATVNRRSDENNLAENSEELDNHAEEVELDSDEDW